MSKTNFKDLYNPADFAQQGLLVFELLQDFLQNAQSEGSKTINYRSPEEELDFWKNWSNTHKEAAESQKIKALISSLFGHTNHIHNPKYIGHQVGAPLPINSFLGAATALSNNGMAVYEMGMAPTAMERIVTDWLCSKVGYGQNSRGFLTSGGTLANLTALLAARRAIIEEDIWHTGSTKKLGVMVSAEAHYCIDRAARIMGLGDQGIIGIPVNSNFCADATKLEEVYQKAVNEDIEVFAIVGSAPSTATGNFDPLEEMGAFAKSKSIWFHVDGAHGGAVVLSKKYKHLMKGSEHADSIVIDGHKMMLMPTLTTALLFKNGDDAHRNFNQRVEYLLHDTEEEDWYNGAKRTFECTKTMTSVYWYTILQVYGEKIFEDFIDRQFDLAKDFIKILDDHPSFEYFLPPDSNIVCFRYLFEGSQDEINQKNNSLRQLLLEDGTYYCVKTVLNKTQFLRVSLMNATTEVSHLKEFIEFTHKMAQKLV